ncbi:MAG: PilZ domain-containing protein [Deltaproteobacteria bacterium]|nr:PilZ domain-containing protein [Deltaproteobacteria bacterium]
MAHVLTASNSEVLRLLGTRACSRLGLSRHVVSTGRDALESARRLKPKVAVLDVDMPDLDGYEVCRRIKADPELKGCRVMLVLTGILTRAVLDRLAEAGCDDALVMPTIGEEFFCHVADLLKVPRRGSRRVNAELMARLDGGTRMWTGRVENVSLTGAKVVLQDPLGPVPIVRARIEGSGPGQIIVADARVVWRSDDGRTLGLEFQGLLPEARQKLEAIVLFEVVEEGDVLRVFLDGDFVETTSFAGLETALHGRVEFDAAGVRYINSQGSRRWTAFLRELAQVPEYTFSRCSVAFTTQASLLPAFLGRGRVISFQAPYHCDDCERDESRLLQTVALVREGASYAVPRFRCAECGGQLAFDELPERYFGFLA